MAADTDDLKIARLELGPDDILALSSKRPLHIEAIKRLQETVRRAIGDRKCLVLEGLDIAVLSPTAADQVLAGKTRAQLREMFERGEISRNQAVRAECLLDAGADELVA